MSWGERREPLLELDSWLLEMGERRGERAGEDHRELLPPLPPAGSRVGQRGLRVLPAQGPLAEEARAVGAVGAVGGLGACRCGGGLWKGLAGVSWLLAEGRLEGVLLRPALLSGPAPELCACACAFACACASPCACASASGGACACAWALFLWLSAEGEDLYHGVLGAAYGRGAPQ